MGGERERAELAAFEALLSKCIADALVAQLRKEAEAQGVDLVTWLMREWEHGRIGTPAPGTRRPVVEDQAVSTEPECPAAFYTGGPESDGCATGGLGRRAERIPVSDRGRSRGLSQFG